MTRRIQLPPIARRIAGRAASGFGVPICILSVFAALIVYGALTFPGGFRGEDGLNTTIAVLLAVWSLGFATRLLAPASKLAGAVEALCLFGFLSLFAALAAAVLAVGDWPYVDSALAAIDHALLPSFDWPALVRSLPDHPRLFYALNQVYESLKYQPLAFLLAALAFGRLRDMHGFSAAWAIGLAGCILPFHFLPAQGAYTYYGVTQDEVGGLLFTMPFEFPRILGDLRSGAIDTLSLDCVTGLVSMPSFHACGATILAWSWWRFELVRWPMAVLNVSMAMVAIPIGSHYAVDIVAGIGVGLAAIAVARAVERAGAEPVSARLIPMPSAALTGLVKGAGSAA